MISSYVSVDSFLSLLTYTCYFIGNQLTKTTDEGTAAFTYNVFNQQT